MKSILALSILLFGSLSHADGFLCNSPFAGLKVSVFNRVHPGLGTRSPAILIVAKDSGDLSTRTIAVFRPEKGGLKKEEGKFVAYMGHREDDVSSGNTTLSDWKLEDIYSLVVGVDFSYSQPVDEGAVILGQMVVVHYDGGRQYIDLTCQRYLKD